MAPRGAPFYKVDSILDVAERILKEKDGSRMPYALVKWANSGTRSYKNSWQPFTDLNGPALADAQNLMQSRKDTGPPVQVFLDYEAFEKNELSDDPENQKE
jgi:hypothetical protein